MEVIDAFNDDVNRTSQVIDRLFPYVHDRSFYPFQCMVHMDVDWQNKDFAFHVTVRTEGSGWTPTFVSRQMVVGTSTDSNVDAELQRIKGKLDSFYDETMTVLRNAQKHFDEMAQIINSRVVKHAENDTEIQHRVDQYLWDPPIAISKAKVTCRTPPGRFHLEVALRVVAVGESKTFVHLIEMAGDLTKKDESEMWLDLEQRWRDAKCGLDMFFLDAWLWHLSAEEKQRMSQFKLIVIGGPDLRESEQRTYAHSQGNVPEPEPEEEIENVNIIVDVEPEFKRRKSKRMRAAPKHRCSGCDCHK